MYHRCNPTVPRRGFTPWKWKDKVGIFQEVKKKALELVLELGPLFEEAEKEKVQSKEDSKEGKEDKGRQQLLLEAVKKPST
jgi:hypothetical protein